MRKSAIFVGICLAMASGQSFGDEFVNGYYRSNGTYVQSYERSSPDDSYNNNWSVSPNVNPYTGEEGTRAPTWNDQAPSGNTFGGGCGMNC